MKSILIALLLVLLAIEADAQSTRPIDSFQVSQPKQAPPNLQLDDWRNVTGWPVPPKPGITLYFDYTKFFEWLLPKKHPKIPPECDPNFFLRDSIPQPPTIKEDSLRLLKPPV